MEEPEQTAPLKALEELGMIDQQSKDSTEVNDLKSKIWEAELAQRNFAAGLPHCNELNGANFYFYQRDRVLAPGLDLKALVELRGGEGLICIETPF